MPVPRPSALARRRLVASFVLAFIVTFVSWVGGFALAESGAWGGEHGILYWCVVSPGLGLSFAAFRLGLRVPAGIIASSPWLVARVWADFALGIILQLVQFALLVTIFYWLGTWWARRRARGRAAA